MTNAESVNGFDSDLTTILGFNFEQVKLADQNEKTARQKAAFSSRENSSNGGLDRQNILAKSYEPKKEGVKEFL
jgi:hypothetical protein